MMGAKAGRMTFEVLAPTAHNIEIPVRVKAESNSFFTKIRKTRAEIVSYLRVSTLRPTRFHEDLSKGR